MKEDGDSSKVVQLRDLRPVAELVCWLIVALVLVSRIINGPAVTIDQLTIRTTLFGIALVAGMGLRIRQIFHR